MIIINIICWARSATVLRKTKGGAWWPIQSSDKTLQSTEYWWWWWRWSYIHTSVTWYNNGSKSFFSHWFGLFDLVRIVAPHCCPQGWFFRALLQTQSRPSMPTFRDNVSSQSFHRHHHHHHHQYLYKSERKNCIKCFELCCNIITKSSSMFKLELKFNFFTLKLFIFIISLLKKAELSVTGQYHRRIRFNCKMPKSYYGMMFVYCLQLQ